MLQTKSWLDKVTSSSIQTTLILDSFLKVLNNMLQIRGEGDILLPMGRVRLAGSHTSSLYAKLHQCLQTVEPQNELAVLLLLHTSWQGKRTYSFLETLATMT